MPIKFRRNPDPNSNAEASKMPMPIAKAKAVDTEDSWSLSPGLLTGLPLVLSAHQIATVKEKIQKMLVTNIKIYTHLKEILHVTETLKYKQQILLLKIWYWIIYQRKVECRVWEEWWEGTFSTLPATKTWPAFFEISSATKEVATLRRGRLNNLEIVLKTVMEIPAEANSSEPMNKNYFKN